MRKLTVFFMALILFNLSFTKEKIDTTFTFQEFSPMSESSIKITERTKTLGMSRISYPAFSGKSSDVVKNMNKAMEKFVSEYKSTKNKTYVGTSEVTANNNTFISVLFTFEERDTKTGKKTKLHDAISFNLKNGKPLLLKDLFVDGYNNSLKSAINDKFKQFGLDQVDKFNAIPKRQSFYLNNDSLVLIYSKGEGSNFADGETFIPLILGELVGILK